MALFTGLAPTLTLNFRDNNNKTSSMLFYLPAAVDTIAEALTAANALRDAIRPLTNAALDGGSVSFPLGEDTPGAAVPESEVERKLFLSFRGANKRQSYITSIPSNVFSIETTGTDVVDQANPLVAAAIAAIIAQGVTNRGEALLTLAGYPYVDHRNRSASKR